MESVALGSKLGQPIFMEGALILQTLPEPNSLARLVRLRAVRLDCSEAAIFITSSVLWNSVQHYNSWEIEEGKIRDAVSGIHVGRRG